MPQLPASRIMRLKLTLLRSGAHTNTSGRGSVVGEVVYVERVQTWALSVRLVLPSGRMMFINFSGAAQPCSRICSRGGWGSWMDTKVPCATEGQ